MEKETKSIPMIALRGMTILPEMVIHFDVSREKSKKAIEEAMIEEGQKIFLVAQKDMDVENPGLKDVYEVGTIATIRQIVKLPKNIVRVLISGEQRAEINGLEFEEPYLRANVSVLEDVDEIEAKFGSDPANTNVEAMMRGLREIFTDYTMRHPKYPKDMAKQLTEKTDLKKCKL